jgi:hypothetical protein
MIFIRFGVFPESHLDKEAAHGAPTSSLAELSFKEILGRHYVLPTKRPVRRRRTRGQFQPQPLMVRCLPSIA